MLFYYERTKPNRIVNDPEEDKIKSDMFPAMKYNAAITYLASVFKIPRNHFELKKIYGFRNK